MIDVSSYIGEILSGKRTYVELRNPDVPLYKAWYGGYDKNFHKYNIYNGSNYVECTRKSLGMGKQIAEDWRSLILNEKTDIVLPENKKLLLDTILKRTKFWSKANDGVEVSYALGIGAFVNRIENLEVNDNGSIVKRGKFNTDFVDADIFT